MDYNPFSSEYASLIGLAKQLKDKQSELRSSALAYKVFDVHSTFSEVCRLDREIAEQADERAAIITRISQMTKNAEWLGEACPPWYDIRATFSGRRAQLESVLRQSASHLEASRKDLAEVIKNVERKNGERQSLKDRIQRHQSVNPLENEAACKAIDSQLAGLNEQIAILKPKYVKVERRIAHLVANVSNLLGQQAALERDIKAVSELEEQLSGAEDGKRRAIIHEECRARYGHSRPQHVLKMLNASHRRLGFDIQKLEARIVKEAQAASRDIQQLVIDGNNMCYDNNGFVGLGPVVEAVDDLVCMCSVIVVFDSDIRGLQKASDYDIQKCFPDLVEVHIVATKEKADQTLLALASDNRVFVVSNDRYVDYPDQPAVIEQRVIRHEITREKVFIHELGVDRSYTAERRYSRS